MAFLFIYSKLYTLVKRINQKMLFILFILARIALLITFVLSILTVYQTLKLCSKHNQRVDPALVWLNLIPLYNLIWSFYFNPKFSDSLKKELEERQGESAYDGYAFWIGLIYPSFALLYVIYWVFIPIYIPYLSILLFFGFLIAWIVFWYKVMEYKKQLQSMEGNVHFKNDLLDSTK